MSAVTETQLADDDVPNHVLRHAKNARGRTVPSNHGAWVRRWSSTGLHTGCADAPTVAVLVLDGHAAGTLPASFSVWPADLRRTHRRAAGTEPGSTRPGVLASLRSRIAERPELRINSSVGARGGHYSTNRCLSFEASSESRRTRPGRVGRTTARSKTHGSPRTAWFLKNPKGCRCRIVPMVAVAGSARRTHG